MRFEDFLKAVTTSLLENFGELDRWFAKDERLRSYKPHNGGWSINDILEHISLTNHFLLILIHKGKEKALIKTDVPDINELFYDDDELNKFAAVGEHQSFDWVRPEHMEPTGTASLNEVRGALSEQLKTCLEVLELLKDGRAFHVKTKMSVNDLGKIDVYQYVYFLSLHARRHIGQMKKVESEFIKDHLS